MSEDTFVFEFKPSLSFDDVRRVLCVSISAIEGLHGAAEVRLGACVLVNHSDHNITVDGSAVVGAELVRVFTSLLIREFGENGWAVRRQSQPAVLQGSVS